MARFEVDKIMLTRSMFSLYEKYNINFYYYLGRHASGDWGNVINDELRQRNESAIKKGDPVLSAYDVVIFPGVSLQFCITTFKDHKRTVISTFEDICLATDGVD